MGLSSDLITQFIKSTRDNSKRTNEESVYGVVSEQNGEMYVKLDGSDVYTPIGTSSKPNSTVKIKDGDRVVVRIKNHAATVTGNITNQSAGSLEVEAIEGDVGTLLEVDELIVGYLGADYAKIKELVADGITVDTLIADSIDAAKAEIDELYATSAEVETLVAERVEAKFLEADYATFDELAALEGRFNNLDATYASIESLEAVEATVRNLDATYATIENLNAEKARIDHLEATTLTADDAIIKNLQADVADIDTLIFGSASGDVIQTSFANAVIAQLGNAQIKSAMIESVTAAKITAGDINTNNVRVVSEDGKLLISDETIQISDSARVRVQIGKDAAGDYSINVWDADGKLMFSEGGITDSAIKEAIIRNDMVSENANISANKLDIASLFEEINDSVHTIKSSKVYLDDETQTLDVAFTSLTDVVGELGDTVSSQGTQLSVVQGQINTRVWQQDIESVESELGGRIDNLSTQHSELKQSVEGISATVGSHTTEIAKKADTSTVTTVQNKVSELELSLDGFKSTVSSTYATNSSVSEIREGLDNLEIGGRNILVNTKTMSGTNIIKANAATLTDTYKDFKVLSYDNRAATTGSVDILTFRGIYPEKLGSTYTLSFYAKGSGDRKLVTFFYGATGYLQVAYATQSDGVTSKPADGATYWTLTDEWQRYWVTWTLKDDGDISIEKYVLFRLNFGGAANICGVKLEKGNRATDWTPAPEDVDKDIATAQAAAEAAQATANQNAVDMAGIVTNFNSDISNLQTQIDGSITTWFYEVPPTSTNKPAVDWTSMDDKNNHLGDLYYDTITGYCYRWQVANNQYSWQRITDTDVTKALSDAQAAQDTADQKRRVFYTQPSPPYDPGDLWVQGSGGDILRCKASKITGQSYSASDWIAASKYTDDTAANSAAQKASEAQSAADAAQRDIDNLTIGGRNLLFNSRGNDIDGWVYGDVVVVEDSVKGHCVEKRNSTTTEQYIGSTRTNIVEVSTEYTFSADIWCNEHLSSFDFFWLSDTNVTKKTGAGYVNIKSKANQTVIPNTWTRVSWTFTTNADDYTGFFRIDNNATKTSGTAAILRVANLKFEKGNRATDWTPAPEDLETRVETAETQLVQTSDAITSLASRTTTVENKFANYSTTAQMNSAIEQKANSITSTVSSTYTTKTEFNNLEVGGRNLVSGTDETTEYVGNKGSSTYKDVWTAKTIVPPQGTEYIVSFDARAAVAQTIQCYFYSPNTTTSSFSSTGQSTTGADGSCTVNITTEWARYWVKWTQTPAETNKSIIVGRNFTTDDIYIRAVKFESGNKATDWTPAPEDLTSDIASAQETADDAAARSAINETLIQQLSDCISMLVTDGTGASLMTQTENGWTFSTGSLEAAVGGLSDSLGDLNQRHDNVSGTVDALNEMVQNLTETMEYVRIGVYEDEPCIELGESDSDFKLLITNTRILFREGSSTPAYITNRSLHIKKAVIEEELIQGQFVWQYRSNGNLGLIWKGVTG